MKGYYLLQKISDIDELALLYIPFIGVVGLTGGKNFSNPSEFDKRFHTSSEGMRRMQGDVNVLISGKEKDIEGLRYIGEVELSDELVRRLPEIRREYKELWKQGAKVIDKLELSAKEQLGL